MGSEVGSEVCAIVGAAMESEIIAEVGPAAAAGSGRYQDQDQRSDGERREQGGREGDVPALDRAPSWESIKRAATQLQPQLRGALAVSHTPSLPNTALLSIALPNIALPILARSNLALPNLALAWHCIRIQTP